MTMENVDLVIEICEEQDGKLVSLHHYRCTCVPVPGDTVLVRGVGYRVVSRSWESLDLTTHVLIGVTRL